MRDTLVRKLRTGAVAVATTAALAAAGAIAPQAAGAAEAPAPLIHYTFDAANAGVVADASGNGYDATIKQTGATVDGGQLSLPGGARATAGYLDIPTAGLVGKTQLTVSTWLETRTGPANVAAAFIGAPVASGASYSSAYWLLNPGNPSGYVKSVVTNTVSATAPWGTEVGAGATNAATTGARTPSGMALYTTVIDGVAGKLTTYVNGAQINQVTIARNVSSFGSSLVSYLGRSTYNDANWAGSVDDYAVYGAALDAATVQQVFADQAIAGATAAVTVAPTATADFALPTSNRGATISWASNSPAIAVSGELRP
ncbi:LamG-like jellyroll fold domain-containing protein [Agromyces sp. MMS24-K17]|uniref:LamG-like jellyroll fold domain-containing protein n=1 Tax=Agromyces sp. MMS24-K17 TaxID=3372850 RepID=UPI0037540B3C